MGIHSGQKDRLSYNFLWACCFSSYLASEIVERRPPLFIGFWLIHQDKPREVIRNKSGMMTQNEGQRKGTTNKVQKDDEGK